MSIPPDKLEIVSRHLGFGQLIRGIFYANHMPAIYSNGNFVRQNAQSTANFKNMLIWLQLEKRQKRGIGKFIQFAETFLLGRVGAVYIL